MNEFHFDNIEYHIRRAVSQAQSRILIAVAWFSNTNIADALIQNNKAEIEIIVDDNDVNRKSSSLQKLSIANVEISYIKDLRKEYYLMHNKFCVIDNQVVITGSYNWTQRANKNYENIAILKDFETSALYAQEFRSIKDCNNARAAYFFSDEETSKIVTQLCDVLKSFLKERFEADNLKQRDLLNFFDNKIINQIRGIDESIRNKLMVNPPSMAVYETLIEKYGLFFHVKASEEELMNCISNFKKGMVRNIELGSNILYQRFKMKAIRILTGKYRNLLKKYTEGEESDRIIEMFTYLKKEECLINDWLNESILEIR